MGVRAERLTPQLHRLAPLGVATLFSRASRGFIRSGHTWHKISSFSPPAGGSDQRSCLYLWGSTGTRQQQTFPDALVCAAHCTLLDAHLHSDGSVC